MLSKSTGIIVTSNPVPLLLAWALAKFIEPLVLRDTCQLELTRAILDRQPQLTNDCSERITIGCALWIELLKRG